MRDLLSFMRDLLSFMRDLLPLARRPAFPHALGCGTLHVDLLSRMCGLISLLLVQYYAATFDLVPPLTYFRYHWRSSDQHTPSV